MNRKPAAVVFDAYGTLFDVHALQDRLEALFAGKGAAISQLWRVKQIDYTWLRTLSGRYADFRSLTADALDYACEANGAELDVAERARLLRLYETLPLFADVAPALSALEAAGLSLGVLSNANADMLQAALTAAGIAHAFAHVLSVDAVRKFKTSPEAYRLATDAFAAPAHDIVFVSSNGWDAAGAKAFGFAVFWVNRQNTPAERLGAPPDAVGRTLADLPPWLGR